MDKGTVTIPYTAAEVTGMLSNADTATATVDLRKAGTYVFRLTVTDNEGATGTNNITVTVNLAEVTVNLASIDLSVGDVTSLNLAPVKGAGWTNITGELSSTLSETDEAGSPTSYFDIDGNTISIPDVFFGHPWPPPPRITQTFTYNGKPIGSFYFNLRSRNIGGHQFTHIYKWDTEEGPFTSFPGAWNVTLNLNEL